MTSLSSYGSCGSYAPIRGARPSAVELRALRALRRAGSRGLLHAHLLPKMRPARPPKMRFALAQLERRALIEHIRATQVQGRMQGAWRITDRGRELVDAIDREYPPAA